MFQLEDNPNPARRAALTGALIGLLSTATAAQTVLSGNVSDETVGPLLAGEVYHSTGFYVPNGKTLTIQPGAMLKLDGAIVSVPGTLNAIGTPADPIWITSIYDDTVGGDTNGDGPSSGTPGDWRRLQLSVTSSCSFEQVVFRFGGVSGSAPITSSGATFSATDCTFENSFEEAIDLAQRRTASTIAGCSFLSSGTYPIEGATIDDLQFMSDNTAAGSGLADYVPLRAAYTQTDVTIGPENLIGGVLVTGRQIVAGAGTTLTLEAGVVVKWLDTVSMADRGARVSGILQTRGTASQPVVFTSFADDEHGGDTNGDGPSAGTPGEWSGLRSDASGLVDLEHTLLRFGGGFHSAYPPVHGYGGMVRMRDVTVERAQHAGMNVSWQGPMPDVQDCRFDDNGTYPIEGVSVTHLQGFRNNEASDNGTADALLVTRGDVQTEVTIGPKNYPGRVLIINTTSHVRTGGSLTIERGTIVKADGFAAFSTDGEMHLMGTAFEPVVFTSIHDDTRGGDTNKNGSATLPAEHDLAGFAYAATATGSAENVLVRYSSIGFYSLSPAAWLRSIRAEHCSGLGMKVSAHSGHAMNWVAFDCGDGIEFGGTGYDLLHATTVGNDGNGIYQVSDQDGRIVNSISWGNGEENYLPDGTGGIFSSNGVAGSWSTLNGNIYLEPRFVDEAGGDLRLRASSPCVDTADSSAAMLVVKDHSEHSRMLDPTLSGNLLADMGAYERYIWNMNVRGKAFPGGAQRFTVTGPPGRSLYMVGLLDGHVFDDPFGFVTCGAFATLSLYIQPVGKTALIGVPYDPSLVGIDFGVQTRTWPLGSTSVGADTNLYRGRVLPLELGRTLPPFNRGLLNGATVQPR